MGNFTRDTFDKLKHYVGVRLQQGVPIVDADWNEQEDIRKHELRTFLKWFIGNGVPKDNDGFRIMSIAGGGVNTIVLTSNKGEIGLSSIVVNRAASTAADALGFGDNNCSTSRTGSSPARLTGNVAGPFNLTNGMRLVVSADGQDEEVVVFNQSDFNDISQATAAEVVGVINNAVQNFTASVGEGNDFIIKGGTEDDPGRCLVDGLDVIIEQDIKYTEQPLYENDALRAEWDVFPLEPLSPPGPGESPRIDTVYLDVWEREVDGQEDDDLVNTAIGMETCVRMKREWVVRVAVDADIKEKEILTQYLTEEDLFKPGHVYYPLATLERFAGEDAINQDNITGDLRRKGLAVLSEEITIKDGNVGIGTTNPEFSLDVPTNGWFRFGSGGDGGRIFAEYGPQLAPILKLSDYDDPPRIQFQQLGYGNSDENNPQFSSWIGHAKGGFSNIAIMGGNVGVGTDNPQEKLEIAGSVRGNQAGALRIHTSTGWTDIGSKNAGWSHFCTNKDRYYFDKEIRVDTGKIGSYNENLSLRTSGETRITIENSKGNVGIGTTTPQNKLDVAGSAVIGSSYAGNSNKTAPTDGLLVQGKVVIGTTESDVRLHVVSPYPSPIINPGGGKPLWEMVEHTDFIVKGLALGNTKVGIGTDDPDRRLHVDGDVRFVGESWANSYRSGSTDSAEYFESKNGKKIKFGTSVVLDGDKIRPSKKGETPIGIISANPLIAGGVPIEWPKKYLKDEFRNQIVEEYKEEIMVPKKEKIKKERQKVKKKKIKEKITRTEIAFENGKYFQKEITETMEKEVEEPVFKEVDLYDSKKEKIIGKHRIPVMETYEEEIDVKDENGQPVMIGSGKFETKTRPKINPEYDETKEYIPREKRPEWNCVGLLGQLPLRKGQPVAPTWIKIKNISKDVELWLVK